MGLFSKKEYVYSNTKYSELLPVGTIVKLNNYDGIFMIFNYRGFVKSKEDKNTYFEVDYWCIPYPLGDTGGIKEPIPVRHNEITNIIFEGYKNSQRNEIMFNLDKIMEEKNG